MLLSSIFVFQEEVVRTLHPWTKKLPLCSLQRRRKFDRSGRLEQFGCTKYWFPSCIYSILVLENIKCLERDGKVGIFKTVWHDWKPSYLSRCFPAIWDCFRIFFVLNGCHILEMWQIHLSEVAVFQLNSRERSVVDWRAMVGWLIQPYTFCSTFY